MQKKLYRHSDSYLKALQKFDSVQLSCEAFFFPAIEQHLIIETKLQNRAKIWPNSNLYFPYTPFLN